jgi:molybdopterin-guanine dinucleotide biosynthesis protein A
LKSLKDKGVNWLNENLGNFVAILPCDDPKKTKEEMAALIKSLSKSGTLPFLEEEGAENPYVGIKF